MPVLLTRCCIIHPTTPWCLILRRMHCNKLLLRQPLMCRMRQLLACFDTPPAFSAKRIKQTLTAAQEFMPEVTCTDNPVMNFAYARTYLGRARCHSRQLESYSIYIYRLGRKQSQASTASCAGTIISSCTY